MRGDTRPIVITGASGLLGASLVLEARERGREVIAVSRRHPLRASGLRSVLVDVTDAAALADALSGARPAWVVHCAAETDLERCEADEAACRRVNADAPRTVARWARGEGAGVVHVSTDAVFDGRRGGYAEADEPAPLSAYGRAKLAGERAVLEEAPDAIVVRTAIYGWNMLPKESLAEWFLGRLARTTRVRGWTDAFFTPILTTDLAQIVLDMTDRGLAGVYHVAGAERVSKHGFGVRIAEVFGLDPSLIEPSSVADAALRAPRGRDLSLSVAKAARALGRAMPGIDAGLHRFRRQREDGTLGRLKALGGASADA